MSIQPDDKDWTWVLTEPCPECGFDVPAVDARFVSNMLRDAAQQWIEVLTTRADVTVRSRPDRWSPLEYGCHVRDVCRVYDHRLARMLAEDGPHYDNWDQDETARADDYGAQDPSTVAAQLDADASRLADRFDTVGETQWARTGFRSDGASFTIDTFSRYFIHDVIHHLVDVGAPAP